MISSKIKALKDQHKQMLGEKKAVARAPLRNSQRQRMRLKRKAKNRSTDDLVKVLTMRPAAKG